MPAAALKPQKECFMNNTKKWNAILRMVGFIAIVAMIGFSMAGCDEGGDSSESVDVIVNSHGQIRIVFNGDENMNVKITTNLPAPNDSFTMTKVGDEKTITGLTSGQKVTVTITVSGTIGLLDAYEEATGMLVGFQVYKN